VGLFDIRNLASEKYHGGDFGVQVLTVQFIHDCGYRTFSNTVSPEDVLLSFGEIIQIHRKVEQGWYNTRTQTSGPLVERILDKGLRNLHRSKYMTQWISTTDFRSYPPLTSCHSCPSTPSA
jgi:hypothetical protein